MYFWNRRYFAHAVLAAVLCGGSLTAAAQAFPEAQRPIRIVVPFSPGGGVDGQARVVAQRLGEILGTTVVVDNKPGAGTLVAAQEVIKAVPNGYTLFYAASSTFAQNPHTMKAATYDPQRDFTPLSLGGQGPLVLAVNAALPVRNVKELIQYARSQPGGISYASFGTGTSAHVFGQIFAQQAGLDLVHVPYRGGADMASDLMTGRVQMAFDAQSRPVVQFIDQRLAYAAWLQAQRIADEVGLVAVGVRRDQEFAAQCVQRIGVVLRTRPAGVGAKIILVWHVLT